MIVWVGIGKINKCLFGTLDFDYGESYDGAISILQQNQKQLTYETNKQISWSKALFIYHNKSLTLFHQDQGKLRNKIEKF